MTSLTFKSAAIAVVLASATAFSPSFKPATSFGISQRTSRQSDSSLRVATSSFTYSNATSGIGMFLPREEKRALDMVPWFAGPPAQSAKNMKKSRNPMTRYEGMMRRPLLRAVERGVTQIQLDSADVQGPTRSTLHGKPLVDLGTLGSLGLSNHYRYKLAIVKALGKYACTFPTSSQWIRHPYWVETTNLVEQVFERPAVLTRSTGLANMAFFSSFIRLDPHKTGGIIMDHDAHASLRLCGASIGEVPSHATLKKTFDVEELERHVNKLSEDDSRPANAPIWYVMDGMVSITGQLPDVKALLELQRQYPKLWIFCDDAHGSGWSGKGGRGRVTDMVIQEANTNQMGYAEEAKRWIMSVCFGKSFGADGGALILPNEEMKDFVHSMSPFCTFTCTKFPIADLALINEAMRMSLDGTVDELQQELSEKVTYLHRRAREELGDMVDLPKGWDETPVLFIPIKRDMETFFTVVKKLHEEGIFVATCAPPATESFGVRVTVQRNSKEADIDLLLRRMKQLLAETAEEAPRLQKS